MSDNDHYYCMCPYEDDHDLADQKHLSSTKAALLQGAKWGIGDIIKIRFLEGDKKLHGRIKAVAKEWTQLVNLTFDFIDNEPADIRIAFQKGNGSWSYLGTQCRSVTDQSKPTMNFGWLTPSSSDDEVRRVVLHEFGHALGLIHEHQNPNGGGIKWNRAAVIKDLSGPPNNWDGATIENNMFRKYSGVITTNVDPNSIMMYPIPKAWTLDGTSVGLNDQLSDKDKEFISNNYS